MLVIWGKREAKYFSRQDWPTQISLNWLGNLLFWRRLKVRDLVTKASSSTARFSPSSRVGHRAHLQTNAGLRLQYADDGQEIFRSGIAR
jgi:hypothetical protein